MQEKIGKYQLENLIAKGGMAEVYRGSVIGTEGFSKPICIKRIRPEHGDDPEFAAMFKREAGIAANLQHPNIVQIFDFDKHEGQLFIAMEYIEGMDLRDVLKNVQNLGLRVPVGFALHVIHGLLSALQHAQMLVIDGKSQSVIHRDVSPHNLLISIDGFVRLADFGIAKIAGSTSATRAGVLKGKLAYLSPEQAAGKEVGPASDLFGAGLVLFEMLYGRRLYIGKTEHELLANALAPKVPAMPWLSKDLNKFINKLLATDPDNRYGSASYALEELENIEIKRHSSSDAGKLISSLKLTVDSLKNTDCTISFESSKSISDETAHRLDNSEKNHTSMTDSPTRISEHGVSKSVEIADGNRRSSFRMRLVLGVVFLAIVGVGVWGNSKLFGNVTETTLPKIASTASTTSAVLTENEAAVEPPTESVVQMTTVAEPEATRTDTKVDDPAAVVDAHKPEKTIGALSVSKFGSLEINCRPWAKVKIDGRDFGSTPINRKRIVAGKHLILLTNSDLEFKKSLSVRVKPGRTTKVNHTIKQ